MSTRRIGKVLPLCSGDRSRPPRRRGLTGEGLEMIRADGGNSLLAALTLVHPDIPVRRCRAHKIMNVLNRIRRSDREDAKRDLHDMMNAPEHHRRAHRRTPLRRPPTGALPEGRRIPARRPRRPPRLLPIPHARRAQAGADHERHRTTLPGGPAKNPAHGHFPGPHPHGTRPLRNCLPELQPGSPVQPRENDIGQ